MILLYCSLSYLPFAHEQYSLYFDDTMSATYVFGGSDKDSFYIGQVGISLHIDIHK